jgi:RHS repeat-associated protein
MLAHEICRDSQTDPLFRLVEKYSYDAFGQPTVTDYWGNVRAGSIHENRFMFTGREWIKELGIYDYRHRFYHPGFGRFLQSDPLGLQTEGATLTAGEKALFFGGQAPEAFSSSEMNLFRYCGDDPVDKIDPLGLENYAAYANVNVDSRDNNSFQSRATQSAGGLAFPFATGPGVIAHLMSATNITRLDFHSHGAADRGLLSGNANARIAETARTAGPNGITFTQFAYAITSGKIDIAKGASIRLFACNQAANAQRLSAMLGTGGRADISVTAANSNVDTKAEKAGIADGVFKTFRDGLQIGERKTLPYK